MRKSVQTLDIFSDFIKSQRLTLSLFLVIFFLCGCQNPPTSEAARAAQQVVANAGWAKHVQIDFVGDNFIFRSDGLPDHEMLPVYQAVSVVDYKTTYLVEPTAQKIKMTIPLQPKLAAQKTSTDIGIIGVAISGAVIYSPYEADRNTVALDDNFVIDGIPFVDSCNGHPGPFGVQYHYHGIPYCITHLIDRPGEHSHLWGYLFDGFPVYGAQGEGGVPVIAANLDECNGHSGPTPEFPNGIYHYHTTPLFPYSIPCYAGEVQLLPQRMRPLLQGVDFWPLDTFGFWGFVAVVGVYCGIGWRNYRRSEQHRQNKLRLPTFLMAAVHVGTVLVFAYAIPEHLVDPTWPDHAHHHALQALIWITGFNLVSLGLLFSVFQRKERWAWWLLLAAMTLMHGGYWVAGWVTGGGAPGILDDILFSTLLVVYAIGLLLSWKEFRIEK